MPNIDTSTIEGFDSMSAEEKVSALLKYEVPEAFDSSKYVLKSVFDKKASETAELSKKLNSKLSESEQAEAAKAKEMQDLRDELQNTKNALDNVLKEKQISDFTARYISQGYSKELAAEKAKAMQSGDTNKIFECEEKFQKEFEKTLKERLINGTPKPDGAGGSDGNDKPKDAAVEKAKEIVNARFGGNKNYNDVINAYK